MGIQERFSQTDRALEEVPTWPDVSHILLLTNKLCFLRDLDNEGMVSMEAG